MYFALVAAGKQIYKVDMEMSFDAHSVHQVYRIRLLAAYAM